MPRKSRKWERDPSPEELAEPHPYYEKFRKGEMINSQAKRVILNVFHHILRLDPDKTKTRVAEETSGYTGVSSHTVMKLRMEKKKSMESEAGPTPATDTPNEGATADPADPNNPAGPLAPGDSNGANPGPLHNDPNAPNSNPTAPTVPAKAPPKKKRPPSPRSIIRKRPGIQKKRLDRIDPAVVARIRDQFLPFQASREKPTVKEFLNQINSDPNLPNFTIASFRRLMIDMGLAFTKGRENKGGGGGGGQNGGGPGGGGGSGSQRCDYSFNYDEAVLTAIRLKLHESSLKNAAPTFDQFLNDVNLDPNMPVFSRHTFNVLLNDMGLSHFIRTV